MSEGGRGTSERWSDVARAEPLGRVLVYGALAIVDTVHLDAPAHGGVAHSAGAGVPGRSSRSPRGCFLVALGWTRGTLPLKPLLAAIGITLVFAVATPSNQSGDVNSYVMYGRIVTVHHDNPFASYPMHFEGDPMRRHVDPLWQRTPDIYGLGFTVIMAALRAGDR